MQGISLVLVDRVRGGQPDGGHAVRGARPAGRAREAGPGEHRRAAGAADEARPSRARRRAAGCCAPPARPASRLGGRHRGRATFAAIFGPLLAPYDPNAAEPVAGLGRPGRRPPARLRLRGPRRAVPAAGGRAVLDARPAGGRRRSAMTAGTLLAVIAAWRRGAARRRHLLRAGHPVRVPRHPARGAGGGGVRRRPDRRGDRAVHRVHALRRPGAARRGAEGAQPAVRRRAGGAGRIGHRDLPAAPDPEHRAADRRAGHDPVRLRDGRPGRDLVPRPRRPAAAAPTGA